MMNDMTTGKPLRDAAPFVRVIGGAAKVSAITNTMHWEGTTQRCIAGTDSAAAEED